MKTATKRHTIQLGGMDDRLVPEPGTAKSIGNLQWSAEGYWEPCWGAVRATAFADNSGPISAIHWFNPRPGQRWLITERRYDSSTSKISYVDYPGGGTPVAICNRRRLDSTDLGTLFLDHGRWVYMLSPLDALVRWDGYRLAPVGYACAAPSPRVQGSGDGFTQNDKAYENAPGTFKSETTQRGVGEFPDGEDPPWLYGYAATLVNDLGQESPMSPIAFATGSNNDGGSIGKRMVRISYPRVGDHIRAVNIWRTANLFGVGVGTPGVGSAMYRHSSWNTAAGFELLDLKADAELGLQFDLDRVGLTPIGARAIAYWSGAMWLAGMPEAPSRLRFSTPLFHEQWPELNYLDVGSSGTGAIVALVPVRNGLLVFKGSSIYIVKGDALNGFRIDTVDETRGAAAPRAIHSIPSVGTLFLDASGPHAVVEQVSDFKDSSTSSVVPIGTGVRKVWREQVGIQLAQAVSVYDPIRNEVWWQVPEGGNPLQTFGLVFHTQTAQWSTRTGWSVGAFAYYAGSVWVGSWDDADFPGVFLVTGGSRARFGSDITGTYTTNPLRASDDTPWTFTHVEGIGLAMGRSTWTVETRSDCAPTPIDQSESPTRQVHHTHDRDVWGTGKFGAAHAFTDYEISRFPISVRVAHAYEHQLTISSQRMRMSHLDLVVAAVPQIVPRPLERR
jgi:hypothetical protein